MNNNKGKIALLGSRGIPAEWGGFETLAEELSTRLVRSGWKTTVFCENPGNRNFTRTYRGVRLEIVKTLPVRGLRSIISQMYSIYRSRKKHDVIYMLGYHASFFLLFLNHAKVDIWINMDGMEWKRGKWSFFPKLYLRLMEKIAVRTADVVIADSLEILKYLSSKHGTGYKTHYISYGARIPEQPPPVSPLEKFGLNPKEYFIAVCRMEPENHVLTILEGYLRSGLNKKFIIVGPLEGTRCYVKRLLRYGKKKCFIFTGGIYNKNVLYALRYHALAYFHGHSVGGTNPSLLESMACGNFIIAHDNPFNREVAADTAFYFRNPDDIARILTHPETTALFRNDNDKACQRVGLFYSWDKITRQYIDLLGKKDTRNAPYGKPSFLSQKMKADTSFKVDFFGLGAPRCRTTWIAQCLDEHPRITISKIKEPTFFAKKVGPFSDEVNKLFLRDWDWYRSLFDHSGKDNLKGELSTDLLCNTDSAPELIAEYFPEAKFFVSLRDPVDRLYSQYWFERIRRIRLWDMWHTGKPDIPHSFEQALRNPEFIFRSRYYEQLISWFRIFPRKRFFIIIDSDTDQDPLGTLSSLFEFLGVNDRFVPPSAFKKVNELREDRGLRFISTYIYKMLRKANLEGIIRTFSSHPVLKNLKPKGRGLQYPPMNAQTAFRLREYFLPDIQKLEKLLGRDLSAWKKCR